MRHAAYVKEPRTITFAIPEMKNWDINEDSAHNFILYIHFILFWQELSSAPLCIHIVVHLYLLGGTVICPVTQTYSYTY